MEEDQESGGDLRSLKGLKRLRRLKWLNLSAEG